jgi:geranylgeranyl diphosphate synthase type II
MVQAMNRASDEEREVLRTTHRRSDIGDSEKIAIVKALYDKLEVKRLTEQQIELRFERALGILDSLSIAGERTQHLRDFARNLMGRKK